MYKTFVFLILTLLFVGCISQDSNNSIEICSEIYSPVCSTDGITYDNQCFAERVNKIIDYQGECEKCVDEDEENIYTKGSIFFRGEKITDTCYSENIISEAVCISNKPAKKNIDCPEKFICNDGICVQQCFSTSYTPLKPDIYQKEIAWNSILAKSDECIDEETLLEYHCSGNGEIIELKEKCPIGFKCSYGRCVSNDCKDLDLGKNPLYRSYVEIQGIREYDVCIDDYTVRETFCTAEGVGYVDIKCPDNHICVNGFCALIKNNPDCADTDGGINPFVSGHIYNMFVSRVIPPLVAHDMCLDEKTLAEFYCVNKTHFDFKQIICPEGFMCEGRKCVSLTSKEDPTKKQYISEICTEGENEFGKFAADGIDISFDDCLNDYYCMGDKKIRKDFNYNYYTACNNTQPIDIRELDITCYESDGGINKYVKGHVVNGTGYRMPGYIDYAKYWFSNEDRCKGDKLIEFYCDNNEIKHIEIEVEEGEICMFGAIYYIGDSPCTDTDGGKNIYKKGITKKGNWVNWDLCRTKSVREYYCNNNEITFEEIPCNNCYDGVCLD